MLNNATFVDAPESWSDIKDFPGYSVSNKGRVLNNKTGCYIKVTQNSRGIATVGLMQDGIQRKRSLTVLVANAFVPRPNNEYFDTPIHLDGDRFNNHYTNLMWRPLQFAREYNGQFTDGHTTYDHPLEDVETHESYINSMHASTTNGVLDKDIYLAMLNNTNVWPTGQIFRDAPMNH
jgi:hypothetical protein